MDNLHHFSPFSILAAAATFTAFISTDHTHVTSSLIRFLSFHSSSFRFSLPQYDQLEVTTLSQPSAATTTSDSKKETLAFGQQFARHMFKVEWDADRGWAAPRIEPLGPLQLHPAAKVLHYAQTVFEGLKAYRDPEGRVRLFRPDRNADRFLKSSQRAALPPFDPHELLLCMRHLLRIERDSVPSGPGQALYVRPTHIGVEPALGVSAARQSLLYILLSPVGNYFAGDRRAVSLLAKPDFVRAWPGGAGDRKMGANYAPTIRLQQQANDAGCEQVLWLFGPDRLLTEVGTMNIFVLFANSGSNDRPQLITPPLTSGLILPGITRDSVLELARKYDDLEVIERPVSIDELERRLKQNEVLEVFGTGTACVISPVDKILYHDRWLQVPTMSSQIALHDRLLQRLNRIYYGQEAHEWSELID